MILPEKIQSESIIKNKIHFVYRVMKKNRLAANSTPL